MFRTVALLAMKADALRDSLAIIASGRRVTFGGLRPPPDRALLRLARRGRDAVAARIAGHEARIAAHANVVAMRGAVQAAAIVAAPDRFLAANMARHGNACRLGFQPDCPIGRSG